MEGRRGLDENEMRGTLNVRRRGLEYRGRKTGAENKGGTKAFGKKKKKKKEE